MPPPALPPSSLLLCGSWFNPYCMRVLIALSIKQVLRGRALLLLLLVAAPTSASVRVASAAPAAGGRTCRLKVTGTGGGAAAVAAVLLHCSPAAPPLVVGINSSLVSQQASSWMGVAVAPRGGLACQRRAEAGDAAAHTPPLYALLFFCGEHEELHFTEAAVLGVQLRWDEAPGRPAHAGCRTAVLAFGGGVRATLANATVANNTASSVLRVFEPASLTVAASQLAGNHGYSGAAVGVFRGGRLAINGSKLAGNKAKANGGGVYASNASVSIMASMLVNNAAGFGAGVAAYTTALAVANCTLARNRAQENGGGIDATNASVAMADCTLTNNTARCGGAVNAINVSIAMANCTLTGNTAALNGGSIDASNTSVSINGSRLNGNAAVRGGAVSAHNSTVHVRSCRLEHNVATGGGAFFAAGSVLAVHATSIQHARALATPGAGEGNELDVGMGGGVFAQQKSIVRLSGGTNIAHCLAHGDGGGVHLRVESVLHLHGSGITNCMAYGSGGGLCLIDSVKVVASHARLASNSAHGDGGAALLSNASGLFSTCAILNNTATGRGGGVFGGFGSAASRARWLLALNGSTVMRSNHAGTPGGGDDIFAGPDMALELAGSNVAPNSPTVAWHRQDCVAGEQLVDRAGERLCEACPSAVAYSLRAGPACLPCPASARCMGGAAIVPLSGFWAAPHNAVTCPGCALDNIVRCPNPGACEHDATALAAHGEGGVQSWTPADLCSRAYTGPVCGACASGFGQTAPFSCHACLGVDDAGAGQLDGRGIAGLWSLYGLVLLAFTLLATWAALASAAAAGGASPDTVQLTDVLKALMLYAQWLHVLIDLPVSWLPAPAASLATSRRGLSSSTWSWLLGWSASLDCLLAGTGRDLGVHAPGFRGAATLLTPCAVYVAALLCQVLWWRVQGAAVGALLNAASHCECAAAMQARLRRWHGRAKEAKHSLSRYMRDRWVVTLLVVLFWCFTSVARTAVGSLACVSVCEPRQQPGCSWWALDTRVPCPTSQRGSVQWRWAVGVGVPALVWCLALPAAVAGLLWWAAAQQCLDTPLFARRFGFLYADCRLRSCPECEPGSSAGRVSRLLAAGRARIVLAWTAVLHVLSLLLQVIAVLGASRLHEHHQVAALTAMLVCYSLLVVWLRPFRAPAMQHLQVASALVLCATSLCVLTMIEPAGLGAHKQDADAAKAALGWLALLLNACFVLLACGLLLACLVRECVARVRGARRQQCSPPASPEALPGGKASP